jgi:hypothetical protein
MAILTLLHDRCQEKSNNSEFLSTPVVTKRFDRVEDTGKGKLLYNQVTAALDSMGRAISNQEKRQILMEILKNLCE